MAGTTATSVVKTTYNSTGDAQIQWCALATEAGRHIDVRGLDGTKMILLVTGDSTDQTSDVFYIGCTDTDDSDTAPFSAGKQNQMKVSVGIVTAGTAYAKLRATGATHLKHLTVIGPFETARFKDSDGYINIAKGRLGSTSTFICPILLP